MIPLIASCFNCSSTRKRTCRRVTRFVFGLPPPRIAGFLALAAVFFRGVAVADRVLLGGAGGTGRASGAVTRFGLGRPTPRVAGLVRAVVVAVGGIAVAERVLRRGGSAAGIGCAGGAAAGADRAGGAGGRCGTSCVARMGVLLRVLRRWTRLAVRSVTGWVGSVVVPVAPTLGAPWVSPLGGPCWSTLGGSWFFKILVRSRSTSTWRTFCAAVFGVDASSSRTSSVAAWIVRSPSEIAGIWQCAGKIW